MKHLAAPAAILLAATGAMLSPAQGQDLARQGPFSLTWVFVNAEPFAPVDFGDGRQAIVQTYVAAAVNDEGAGFLHDTRGRCVALQIVDRSAGTFEAEGYCDYADRSGDHAYESFATPGPQPLSGIRIEGRWTGGTGKCLGLTGAFEIRSFGTTTNAETGFLQNLGSKTGSYALGGG